MLRFFIRLSAVLFISSVILPAQPIAWFTPLPAAQHPVGYFGATDYMNLFNPAAPWQQAAAHVKVLKIYGVDTFSDSDLLTMFAYLTQQNMALALEWPVLTSSTCGAGIEGFGGNILPQVQRIQALGGTLTYLAMLQPFQWGSLYQGAGSCQWTAQQVAANALLQVNQAKTVFPNLLVGDIMAVPTFQSSGSTFATQFGVWFDTWRNLTGAPLAFFHVDVDWTTPNWQAAVAAVRPVVEQRGIPFGLVYNGFLTNESDADWLSAAERHFVDYEVNGGAAPPEQVNFQSWNPNPTHVLPETDSTAFTYLIDRYFRARTSLTLSNNGTQLSGKLNSGANGVGGAAVQLTSQPLSGPGTVTTYTISGTAPNQASKVTVGVRINSECYSCNGPTDLTLYSFRYSDSQGTSLTWGFPQQLNGWFTSGTGTTAFSFVPVYGPGLDMTAQAGQPLGLTSLVPAPVVSGVPFTLQVTARVSPVSIGSGYFTLIWLDAAGNEPSRETIMFEPQSQLLTMATTAADGTFAAGIAVDPNSYQVTAQYAGSSVLWPAVAAVPAIVTPGSQPAIVSLSPSTASGASTTFSAVFSDAGGWSAIANAQVLVATGTSLPGGCNISYLPASGTFQLLNDAGTAWSSTILSNSQCTLSGATASGRGNDLTLNFTITLTASFGASSQKLISLQATDSQGMMVPLTAAGTWPVVLTGCTLPGAATATDVQSVVTEAQGAAAPNLDINGDHTVNIVDVQLAIGDVIGCQTISATPAGFGSGTMAHSNRPRPKR